MQYLSDEWIDAADTALSQAWSSVEDKGDRPTTITYTVSGAPADTTAGKVTYTVTFGPDGSGVSAGEPESEPDATMALDYDTAVEIARGDSSAQAAFMQGRLKLGGDVTILITGAERFGQVGDALGTLRDATTF